MTEETKKAIDTTVVPDTAEATENTEVLDDTATIVTPPAGIILDGDKKQLVLTNPAPAPGEDDEEDPETPYLASDMYARVVTLINKFEEDLPDDLQAGGRLVSAGNITFSIQDVGHWDPNMIVFYGELEDGSRVELLQHLSQLNLLLVAVKRPHPEEPRRVIGFTTSPEPDVETEPTSVEENKILKKATK